MDKATADVLNDLHREVASSLLDRIRSGEAKAADIAAAVRFLSDNGVKAEAGDDAMGGLKDELAKLSPFKATRSTVDILREDQELAD